MKRKLKPASATRVEYPTLDVARILLAGMLACGPALADTSVPQAAKGKVVVVVKPGGGPPAPRLDGEMPRPVPPPPGAMPPPRPIEPPPKVEKKK